MAALRSGVDVGGERRRPGRPAVGGGVRAGGVGGPRGCPGASSERPSLSGPAVEDAGGGLGVEPDQLADPLGGAGAGVGRPRRSCSGRGRRAAGRRAAAPAAARPARRATASPPAVAAPATPAGTHHDDQPPRLGRGRRGRRGAGAGRSSGIVLITTGSSSWPGGTTCRTAVSIRPFGPLDERLEVVERRLAVGQRLQVEAPRHLDPDPRPGRRAAARRPAAGGRRRGAGGGAAGGGRGRRARARSGSAPAAG